jgi:hypothetical protein
MAARDVIAATFDTFESRWLLGRAAVEQDSRLRIESRTPIRLTGRATAITPTEITIPIAYFPGWRVWIDRKQAKILEPAVDGLIRVRIDAGSHRVEARFGTTRIRRLANVISLFAVFVMIGAISLPKALTSSKNASTVPL